MKKAEIVVGGHYIAKVSNKIVTVRVDAIDSTPRYAGTSYSGQSKYRDQVVYRVTNLKTGRTTTFRSAAKFRGAAKPEGEKRPIPTAPIARTPAKTLTIPPGSMTAATVEDRSHGNSGRRTIKNWYIKDTGDGQSYMSGMAIPRDPDGVTRNIDFVDCDLHPASHGVFENCAIDGKPIPDGPGCLYDHYNKMLQVV